METAVSSRHKALKVMQGDNSEEHLKQYQEACAEASRVIMESKRGVWHQYYDSLDGSSSVAEAWKTIASLSGEAGSCKDSFYSDLGWS